MLKQNSFGFPLISIVWTKTTTDVNVNGNCLVIFFYVQQKTEMHTGLE